MVKFKKILVANRGEIAGRILRACRKMNIKGVAVYSDVDQNARHVKMADESIFIGGAPPRESYLNMNSLIAAAKRTNCEAIHPGYGFLSENAEFAKRCSDEGLVFIGPHSETIAELGNKTSAKKIAARLKIPIPPSCSANNSGEIEKIGFPLLIKAAAGGGGRGMRLVSRKKDLTEAIAAAERESLQAFGSKEIFIEKCFSAIKHIEVQILADAFGKIIPLSDRECSAQRRHQKIIEEAPAARISEAQRATLYDWAIAMGKAVHYKNAGTIEFIYDVKTDQFYFLEVNTRLQVEHPVTEMITGLDIVEWQIRIAQGEALTVNAQDIKKTGHAIECRVCAEDPESNFMPSAGVIGAMNEWANNSIRWESGVEKNTEITSHYDSLIAKVIAYGDDREAARKNLLAALEQSYYLGLQTNQNCLLGLIQSPDFKEDQYDTGFVAKNLERINREASAEPALVPLAIGVMLWLRQKRKANATWSSALFSGWRNNFYDYAKEELRSSGQNFKIEYKNTNSGAYEIRVNNNRYSAEVKKFTDVNMEYALNGVAQSLNVNFNEGHTQVFVHSRLAGTHGFEVLPRLPLAEAKKSSGSLRSPLPGRILKVLVKKNDQVKVGDCLIVVESMKMETSISAPMDGVVVEISVKPGDMVNSDAPLAVIGLSPDGGTPKNA